MISCGGDRTGRFFMANAELDKYKKKVNAALARLRELIAAVSVGDFSKRIDEIEIKDDEFAEVFLGFDLMRDDFVQTLKELEAKSVKLRKLVDKRSAQLEVLDRERTIDIAERSIMEQAIRQEEQYYRLLAESAQEGVYIIDRALNIRYVNEFGAQVTGRSREELIGQNVSTLFTSAVFKSYEPAIRAVFDGATPLYYEEKVIVAPDREVWLDTKLIPILDKDGRAESIMGISRDITERKRAERELTERERFYANIFSSMLDGTSILDKDLTIVKVNATMEQWYPYSLPLEGKKCYAAYHQSDKPCEICPTLVTLQTGKAAHETVPKRQKDGVICGWMDLHTFPLIESATGEIKGVIENVREITDRKKMEEDLRQSEEKFRTLANTVSAGIVILKNGKFCYVNQYLLDATGYTFEELRDVNYLEAIHPDYRDEIQRRQTRRMRGEYVPSEFQFKIVMKNGKEAWVHQNAGLIRFEGEPATLATIWDITEQKKIEQALAAEKERLDVTLSSIGDSVISTDIDTNVVTINKIAETLTGFSKEKAVGRPLDEICLIVNPQTHAVYESIFKPMVEKHGIVPYKRHIVMLSGDGAEHQIDMSVAPIRSDEGSVIGMVIVFRDITDRQKLEAELFKARKLESLGVLAGGIAHDFNNILTGIITNLFMAKISMPPASESYKMLLDAEKACFRASRLTKQLLTFSKGGSPVKEVASVKELIEDTVGFCLSGSNANYRLEIPDDLMASTIDKGQIDQVINNLLINALQAMPAGGTITVTAENCIIKEGNGSPEAMHHGLRPGNYVKVSVKDEGVGIPAKDLEKIFDPYFTTKPQGSGLGLTTSYSIIKNHDGAITVESRPCKGSIFSFYLPALEVIVNSFAAEGRNSKYSGGKILVMDDDDSVRTVVMQLLKGFGYEVHCTTTGNETIESYKSALQEGAPFDVVIMDLTIPGGIGGKEVVKILHEADPNIKAIVASGYSNDPVMANFREYGFSGVIVKPFNIDEFVRVLEEVRNS